MFEVKADRVRNRLYITITGYVDEPEAEQVADEVINALPQLQPGFIIITDLSEYIPLSPKVTEHIKRAQIALSKAKAKKVIRIIKNIVGVMQFKRMEKEANIQYQVVKATSPEEAERLADEP